MSKTGAPGGFDEGRERPFFWYRGFDYPQCMPSTSNLKYQVAGNPWNWKLVEGTKTSISANRRSLRCLCRPDLGEHANSPGAEYIEVLPPDAISFPDAIKQ